MEFRFINYTTTNIDAIAQIHINVTYVRNSKANNVEKKNDTDKRK